MQTAAQLRRQVRAIARSCEPHQRRYPSELKSAILAHLDRSRGAGESVVSVAEALEVPEQTLYAWLQARPGPEGGVRRAMRPVEVVPDAPIGAPRGSDDGRLTLVTVAGHRIEGLSADQAAAILRALGSSGPVASSRSTPTRSPATCGRASRG